MKIRILAFLIALAATMLGANPTIAQDKFLAESTDPEEDAVFIDRMRARMESIRVAEGRPTVALVLSGGGAKGAAHVGVQKFIDEMGIPIDFVVGTSMGGLVGGLYALGYSGAQLDSILNAQDWRLLMSDRLPQKYYSYERRNYSADYPFSVPFHSLDGGLEALKKSAPDGYLYGFNINNIFSSLSIGYHDAIDFINLPIPFACVSSDMASVRAKTWTHGHITDAMRSTMSIPFLFKPVYQDGRIYVDGGVHNNYPVDIARAVGADFVIGVDLHYKENEGSLYNVGGLAVQGITGPSLSTYLKNKGSADINIVPDLHGYSTMSFGSEEISEIIKFGYEAALEHTDEFRDLAEKTGAKGRRLSNVPAINLDDSDVFISAIEYKGMSDKQSRFFNDKMDLKVGNRYARKEIEDAAKQVYSTGGFENVRYFLYGKTEPYRLIFECQEGPENRIGLGINADTEELISAGFNIGFHQSRLSGSKFDIDLILGSSPSIKFDYRYVPFSGPTLGIIAKSKYINIFNLLAEEWQYSGSERMWYNTASLYIKDSRWSAVDLRCGLHLDYMPWRKTMKETGIERFWNKSDFFVTAFGGIEMDFQDDSFFPTRGPKFKASYEYLVGGVSDGKRVSGTSYLSVNYNVPITFGENFTILPTVYGRLIFGQENPSYCMQNFIGGSNYGRYFDHQIPFAGYYGIQACNTKLLALDVDFRQKIFKRSYVSFNSAGYTDGDTLLEMNRMIWALGIKYGMKTPLGPITFSAHWCTGIEKAVFYLSYGITF